MENNHFVSAKTSDSTERKVEDEQADIIDAPESHEVSSQDFAESAGQIAIGSTVELQEETSSAVSESTLNLDEMDYQEVDENIDALLESGTSPDDILDRLGPNLYYHKNISKLLDAGIEPMTVLRSLEKEDVTVQSSSTIAHNLDAFIKSGVGVGVIAGHLESDWLSQCFDKLMANGLGLNTVDQLIAEGKLNPQDVEERRKEWSRIPSQDEEFGVDEVLDFATGKTIQASRSERKAAA